MPPSITASTPLHSCYIPQAYFASCTTTFVTNLSTILLQATPTPTGLTPGYLYSPIKRLSMSALYATRGGRSLTIHSANYAAILRRSMISSLKQIKQCFRLIESVPPGPAPPESLHATFITVSSVRLTGTSYGGRPGYASRLVAEGAWASGCFDQITPRTGFPVFNRASPGCITMPFYLSVIYRNTFQSFPRSTRLWNVFARCYSDSSRWEL